MFEKLRRIMNHIDDTESTVSRLPKTDNSPGPGSSKKYEPVYKVSLVVALNEKTPNPAAIFKWKGTAYISRVVNGKSSQVKVFHKYGTSAETVSYILEKQARFWVEDQRKAEGGDLNKTFTL